MHLFNLLGAENDCPQSVHNSVPSSSYSTCGWTFIAHAASLHKPQVWELHIGSDVNVVPHAVHTELTHSFCLQQGACEVAACGLSVTANSSSWCHSSPALHCTQKFIHLSTWYLLLWRNTLIFCHHFKGDVHHFGGLPSHSRQGINDSGKTLLFIYVYIFKGPTTNPWRAMYVVKCKPISVSYSFLT